MISEDLMSVFIVELLASIIGLYLLKKEIVCLIPTIKKIQSLSLIGFLISLNFVYIFRVIGIISENTNIRQFGAALSGLFAGMFLIIWGSININMSKKIKIISLIILILGMLVFIIGRITHIPFLQIIGIAFLVFLSSFIIIRFFVFVFSSSPYVRARQRVLLISLGFLFLIILDGFGIIFLGNGFYFVASILFLFEIPFRILMTIGIELPINIQNYLKRFIH